MPSSPDLRRSPLNDEHLALDAVLVNFAGWDMPLRYHSELAEHQAVRTAAGLFDISHMGEISVRGPDAAAGLDFALVSAVSRVGLGRAKYTMVCAPSGGILDDIIVYRRDWDHFLIVANASNTAAVVAALEERLAGHRASVTDESSEIALIAVQGPRAADIVATMCSRGADDVYASKYYSWCPVVLEGDIHAMCARTGYTGEDGFELFVPVADAVEVWRLALAVGSPRGLIPCGLSARDTLRLEAGMPLYGQELSLNVTPFAAGLGRVVQFDAGHPLLPPGIDGAVSMSPVPLERGDFVGRASLEEDRRVHERGVDYDRSAPLYPRQLVGLVADGKRAARTDHELFAGAQRVGRVTSGAPSPTLGVAIAMAFVDANYSKPGTELEADVRGRREPMTVTALPFYKRDSTP